MGFNRRKMDDERRRAAEKEAAARRALDPQVRRRAANRRLERAPGEAHADAVLTDDRRRGYGSPLVLVGPLPSLPHDQCNRPADARSAPGRRGDKPHTGVVLPLMPAKRAVRRAGAALKDQHRRRDAARADTAGAEGVGCA